MATSRRRPTPSREELQRLLARRQTLGTLIDFAEALEPDDVEPALRLLCSFLATDGSGDAAQLRLWALLGALVTRYLFSIVALPRSRDRVI
jgi:hypothetical protein